MRQGYDGLYGTAMANIKLQDMRARMALRYGDQVAVEGSAYSGMIIEFDPDGRLAKVHTGAGEKWFYVKDLRRI